MTININEVAAEFTDLLNEWHSRPEVFDNALDQQIHRWYAEVKPVWPKRPYFSPSAANSDKRELYVKALGAKRDITNHQPHQGRWTRLGTAIGDMIQRDLLFIEKHMTGARFRFERDEQGRPMFEDFAKRNAEVLHRGHKFYLYGTPDGIMRYTTQDGEEVRIGLEIKSKQTTAAKTSLHSMHEPEHKHVMQTVGYSHMYNVDYYIILYVNAAKKSWVIDDTEFTKSPDIRAFGVEITQADRDELFDYLTDVLDAVETKTPPPLDLFKFTFNNYKTACAMSLTDEEYALLKAQVKRALRSGISQHTKQQLYDAFEFIRDVREGEGA